MTTNQYIGPRIIPVFADPVEWSNTRTYEHLVMVQHEGETYMSQQAVPIGIDLPDVAHGTESNDYWVYMSNWNAQVESYREEVLRYNGRISAIETALPIADFEESTVDSRFDAIETALPLTSFSETTVDSRFDTLETALPLASFSETTIADTIKSADSKLRKNNNKERIFVFVGDSYGVIGSWPSKFVDYTGIDSDQYTNQCENGASFAGSGAKFYNHIVRAKAYFIEEGIDPADVTDILVIGGLNDCYNAYSDTGQLKAAMVTFDERASFDFPNAKIHLGFVGFLVNTQTTVTGNDLTRILYTKQRYIDYAGELGWHYITNIEYSLHGVPGLMDVDGVHPNTAGSERIAKYLASGFESACDVTYFQNTITLTAAGTTGWTINELVMGGYHVNNNVTTFSLNNFALTNSDGAQFSMLNHIFHIDVSDFPFNGNISTYSVSVPVMAYATDMNNKSYLCYGDLTIMPDGLNLKLSSIANDNASFVNETFKLVQLFNFPFFRLNTDMI